MRQCKRCGVYVPHGRMAIHRKENCNPKEMEKIRKVMNECNRDLNKILSKR